MSCVACLTMALCAASPDLLATATVAHPPATVFPAHAATIAFRHDPAAGQFEAAPVVALTFQEDGELELPASTHAPFATDGTRRLYFQGGGGVHVSDSDNLEGFLGAGIEWFVADRFSISAELNAWYFDQIGDNAVGGNFNLLVRYHLVLEDSWSFYVDGGAGILLTTEDVPAHGTSFNFTPQAGAGFTFDIGDQNRLMVGVRWHHISNAGTSDSNPGRDSVLGYAGVSLPF